MTAFFGVHLVLTVVSLTLGTIIGGYGIRALHAYRPTRREPTRNKRELEPRRAVGAGRDRLE